MDQNNQNIIKLNNDSKKGESLFENLLNEVNQVNPALGGINELGVLLTLPDEQFIVISPFLIDELQKSMNNIDDKIALAQAMNISGIKVEDLQKSYLELIDNIDKEFSTILSTPKRDFLKKILSIIYNCIIESQGVSKRIIQIPIELTSKDAKIPTYAHLGDGAVDLYAPKDYTIKPGETVIIPCDIKVALPYGYAFLIHPRSGTSSKTKLRVANSIGLIDSQYKGVIGVIVENIEPPIKDISYKFDENGRPIITSILHGQSYFISKGERFAQMRLVEVPTASFFQVESVDGIGDDRGGGFGSSGTK